MPANVYVIAGFYWTCVIMGKEQGMLLRFLRCESGATAVEYGLIAGLISVALVAGATSVGSTLNSKFDSIGTKVGTGL